MQIQVFAQSGPFSHTYPIRTITYTTPPQYSSIYYIYIPLHTIQLYLLHIYTTPPQYSSIYYIYIPLHHNTALSITYTTPPQYSCIYYIYIPLHHNTALSITYTTTPQYICIYYIYHSTSIHLYLLYIYIYIYIPLHHNTSVSIIYIVHPESLRSNAQNAIAFARRNRPRINRSDRLRALFACVCVCESCLWSSACAYVRAIALTCMCSPFN